MRTYGIGCLLTAVLTVVGCEAGGSPVAPRAAGVAASRVEGDQLRVDVDRGSLDITSRTDERLNIGSHGPRFSWKGELTEGANPLDLLDVGVPGATVSINGTWSGDSLRFTTLVCDKVTYTDVGETSAGQLQVVGTAALPLHRGQPTEKVTTTFSLANTFFGTSDPQAGTSVQLQLSGSGTATVFLDWVPIPVTGLPDGYWKISRIVYRFDH